MDAFAERTGLVGKKRNPRRYLWTDAFAVCNFLGFYELTGDCRHLDMAASLISQVHEVLGRFDSSDERSGWISGLSEEEGAEHPTIGGLRIGKPLPERPEDAPFDEALEWERDGQYFHYLTRWMHALSRMSQISGEPHYNGWALEMAKSVHGRFVHRADFEGRLGIYWKMSVDLSRPQIASMGMHDPLDGLLTYLELMVTKSLFAEQSGIDLSEEIDQMLRMVREIRFVTEDPLGIGGLLGGATLLAQLLEAQPLGFDSLLRILLESGLEGLKLFEKSGTLSYPPGYRLAFREFGVSIGLKGVSMIDADHPKLYPDIVERILSYSSLAEEIEKFWLDPKNRESPTWKEHIDINSVMLATSLAPKGYLECKCKK